MESTAEQSIATGWHAEAFARTKNIKSLDHYLKPPVSPERQRDQGAQSLRQMIQRMKQKQEAEHGTR